MKTTIVAAALAALLGVVPAQAQTELDHRVQRTWDNVFNPPPPGDPRTNYERRRDYARYRERREADRAHWCYYHRGAPGCGGYVERY